VSYYSVDELTTAVIHGTDYKLYAPESAGAVERGLFFGSDEGKAFYFFDPDDVPRRRPYECAVYRLARDYEVTRLADSFWEFVIQWCLGKKYAKLFPGAVPELTFLPCGV
jgi:hypothetical protein